MLARRYWASRYPSICEVGSPSKNAASPCFRRIPPDRDVHIVEVGPRDGLQNIAYTIPTATKLELIRQLSRTGLQSIEATSIVSPRKVPQLADCQDVLCDGLVRDLLDNGGISLPVLVPNMRGLEIALSHNVREIAVFVSATEAFSHMNINCSVAESLRRAKAVAREAFAHGIRVRAYVSCIFHDPYVLNEHGQLKDTSNEEVLCVVRELLKERCFEVSLGDTLGTGTPERTYSLITYLLAHDVPAGRLAGHFHDTHGTALTNVWTAYTLGVRVFDASVAGLGGCPFAPGAKGNVSTKDVAEMFERMGVRTGVDVQRVSEVERWVRDKLTTLGGMQEPTVEKERHDIAMPGTVSLSRL